MQLRILFHPLLNKVNKFNKELLILNEVVLYYILI